MFGLLEVLFKCKYETLFSADLHKVSNSTKADAEEAELVGRSGRRGDFQTPAFKSPSPH